MAPPKPRGYELLTKKACKPLGIPVIPSHLAILTKPINKTELLLRVKAMLAHHRGQELSDTIDYINAVQEGK